MRMKTGQVYVQQMEVLWSICDCALGTWQQHVSDCPSSLSCFWPLFRLTMRTTRLLMASSIMYRIPLFLGSYMRMVPSHCSWQMFYAIWEASLLQNSSGSPFCSIKFTLEFERSFQWSKAGGLWSGVCVWGRLAVILSAMGSIPLPAKPQLGQLAYDVEQARQRHRPSCVVPARLSRGPKANHAFSPLFSTHPAVNLSNAKFYAVRKACICHQYVNLQLLSPVTEDFM